MSHLQVSPIPSISPTTAELDPTPSSLVAVAGAVVLLAVLVIGKYSFANSTLECECQFFTTIRFFLLK